MYVLFDPMPLWFIITSLPLLVVILMALAKVHFAKNRRDAETGTFPLTEILIPIKGESPDQQDILESLLTQSYPNYGVTFIVESEDDPAADLLSKLCQRYSRGRIIVSELATSCAQKNQNLIAGIKALDPDTEIVVFCDSTNVADPDWLGRFTGPIRRGDCEVLTTFRAFRPEPETVGGVSQAIYAAFVLTLVLLGPRPWGGGTAIRREVLDRLNVVDTWSHTVVDDLVLGNLLGRTGIKIYMDPGSILTSPLKKQTITGFLGYLDRQILFPKFTNPEIWLATLIVHLNITMALLGAMVTVAFYSVGLVSNSAGISSMHFLVAMILIGLLLRNINPFYITVRNWFIGFLPCVLLAAFVFLRSIFRSYIDWHGRRYYPGKGGIVLETRYVKP
ncbi:MAG: glycosyltransferase [Desulfomonile tiedjei]|uniref:Glycosyltransferase n=1 Tax=Desulfomonile tiedjei TaxID=2358 RepID=A0A9D6Z1Y5_9BACT|nr:glycosyltransferase [Desulfomonile tiedjei]